MAVILSPLDSRSIRLTAVSDLANFDDPDRVAHPVKDSVVANPNSKRGWFALDCLAARWTRIVSE
jgi:hypothetical protein